MSVINEIAAERARQISKEGWTPEHDDAHKAGELAAGGAAYALSAVDQINNDSSGRPPSMWPWSVGWWKPKGPRRDLIRAAALIVAEVERLDRAQAEKE